MSWLGPVPVLLLFLAVPGAAEDSLRLDLTIPEIQAINYAVRSSDLPARLAVPLLLKIEAQVKNQTEGATDAH